MVFDSATQGGDCSLDQQCAPNFSNCTTDTVSINNQCDTASNTAVNNLPVVEFSGAPVQATFRSANLYAQGDSPPPFPQPQVNPFPQVNPSPFPQVNPVRPDQVQPPSPGPINPFPRPDAVQPRPGDQPLQPGPFSPTPIGPGGFSADQVRQILADRDRALALNRGQKPSDKPGGLGPGPLPPSPDGRTPYFPGPDFRPKPTDTNPGPRPSRTEFLNGEFDDAAKAAADSGRPLIISFTRPNCGACTSIENESWPSQQSAVGDNAVRVKVNSSRSRSLAQQFGVSSYPTTIVVKPTPGSRDLQVLDRMEGDPGATELGNFLQRAFQKHRGG